MGYRKSSSKPPRGAYFFQALLRGTGRTCSSRALPAFSNNKNMVPIRIELIITDHSTLIVCEERRGGGGGGA